MPLLHIACWCLALATISITLVQHILWILEARLTQLGQFIALVDVLIETVGVSAVAYNVFMSQYGYPARTVVLPI